MSTFFFPASHSTPASAHRFSVSDFSDNQRAHAYAEAETLMNASTGHADEAKTSRQPADTDSQLAALGTGDAGDAATASNGHRRAWAAGLVFFTTVFASMAAAATVAGSDLPLMIAGV